jgi:ankyrin
MVPMYGWSSLHLAAVKGHLAITKKLFAKGGLPDVKSNSGYTPLLFAAQFGRSDMVAWLLALDANVKSATKEGGWTPLHLAAEGGLLAVAKQLQAKGALLNALSNYESTPISHAAIFGKSDMITWLLELNVDIMRASSDGTTAFHVAAIRGHLTVAKQLHARGALIDVPSKDGFTPLHRAAQFGHSDTVAWLLGLGANVNAATSDAGWTPLHLTAANWTRRCSRAVARNQQT